MNTKDAHDAIAWNVGHKTVNMVADDAKQAMSVVSALVAVGVNPTWGARAALERGGVLEGCPQSHLYVQLYALQRSYGTSSLWVHVSQESTMRVYNDSLEMPAEALCLLARPHSMIMREVGRVRPVKDYCRSWPVQACPFQITVGCQVWGRREARRLLLDVCSAPRLGSPVIVRAVGLRRFRYTGGEFPTKVVDVLRNGDAVIHCLGNDYVVPVDVVRTAIERSEQPNDIHVPGECLCGVVERTKE